MLQERNATATTSCLLIGDIGGTNARFALAKHDTPGYSDELTYKCADYASTDSAIKAYLTEINAPSPEAICIAAAGPVIDGHVQFTNNSWSLSTSDLEKAFDGSHVRLLNDFEAIAYSIPHLAETDCFTVGLPAPIDLKQQDFKIGIVGPGTGLGTAGLFKVDGRTYPIVGEGGHVSFAPETQTQMEILDHLRHQFERVCDERLISGPGIVNIFGALNSIRGRAFSDATAADVFALALNDGDEIAKETLEIFFEVFGQVAGNLALTLGAIDGIFIGGGIVARNPDLIASSRFRSGFEHKGRYRTLMEQIPTQVIMHPHPGLLGASYCALQLLKGESP